MAKGDKGSTNIIDLSRKTTAVSSWEDDGNSRIHNKLYEAITAGSMQRIADAQESIAKDLSSVSRNLASIADRFPITETQYELLKQVIKLSARLKVAGLDGDPKSDNRGRPRNGKKTTGES